MNELLVRVELDNPRTNKRRDWMWHPETFYDRLGSMRKAWEEWMLKERPIPMHTPSDPLYAAPTSQLIGTAYLYLAPVLYGIGIEE